MATNTDHLRRYAAIARLLVKHGRGDLVRQLRLDEGLGDDSIELGEEVEEAASELADDLENLGPTFIKLGQLLSTRADLLPEPYLRELRRLQDRVAPVAFEEIQDQVEAELGVRISQGFQSFEEMPMAAASLAQVHRAVLRDGRTVAVKVQRPGIGSRVRGDLAVLSQLAELLDKTTEAGRRYRFADLVDQFARSLARELDFRQEARHLEILHDNLQAYERLVVPLPVRDYTSERVLTMQLVPGRAVSDLGGLGRMEVDGAQLADDLFRAYLEQILLHGFVHADPHPGNVLITEDGRLALLDLGMVIRLEPRTQDQLLQLLLAVSEGRGDEVAETAIDLGHETQRFDEQAFRREVADLVGRYLHARPDLVEAGRLVMELARISGQTGLRPPSELALLGRTLLNLDAVGRTLDPEFDTNAALRTHVTELMSTGWLEELSPQRLLRSALDAKTLLQRLPGRLLRIVEALAEGDLTVRVDAVDEQELRLTFAKAINRLTFGIVLAALIVGASLVMRVETEATIFGYPALAIVFFLGAAITGVALLVSIVVEGRRQRRG